MNLKTITVNTLPIIGLYSLMVLPKVDYGQVLGIMVTREVEVVSPEIVPTPTPVETVPTPTPVTPKDTDKPKDSPQTLPGVGTCASETELSIEEEIKKVFGKYGDQAVLVAKCESGHRPAICNDGLNRDGTVDCGVFQINSNVHGVNRKWLKNQSINIRVAYQLFEESGYSWKHWYSSYKCHGLK